MDFLPVQGKKMRHSWATVMFFNEELVEKAQKVWGITFGHLLKKMSLSFQKLRIVLAEHVEHLGVLSERADERAVLVVRNIEFRCRLAHNL